MDGLLRVMPMLVSNYRANYAEGLTFDECLSNSWDGHEVESGKHERTYTPHFDIYLGGRDLAVWPDVGIERSPNSSNSCPKSRQLNSF